jgi:hypothetical protein
MRLVFIWRIGLKDSRHKIEFHGGKLFVTVDFSKLQAYAVDIK